MRVLTPVQALLQPNCWCDSPGLFVSDFVTRYAHRLQTSCLQRVMTITRTAYLYNGCLPWYNVVLISRVHSSVKCSQQSQLRSRATVE